MVKKFDVITKLYEEATQEVTESPEKWIAFLQSASKNYRLPFDEQLLIHVQRPEATAVLPMEKWNEKFGRWVKRDSKGIAVFDKSSDRLKLKYYFDVSDTREGKYKRLVRPVSLWSVAEEQQEPVKEALVNTFGVTDGDRKEFAMVILEASLNIAEDNIGDYLPDILLATKDSPLEEIDEFNIRLKMKQLLANSISYMLFLRCGIEPDIYLETRDFQNIRDFHTKELVNLFGVTASDMSEMALGEVADTIRKLKIQERKQRTFVEQKTTDYNVDNKQEIATERGQDNGSNHIQQTGRLSPAESYNSRGRGSSPWEVRISPKTISDEESVRNVSESSDSGNIEPASDSDGGRSTEQNGDTYSADGRERGRDRRTESQRSDGVDRENEQYPAESAGNREERNPGELEENNRSSDILPSEEEQLQILEEKAEEKSPAFSFSQELIDEVLQDGPHFADGKYDIYSYLKQEHSTSENVKFLQGAYGIGGRTLNINGIKLDENYDSKGIKLRKGYEVDSPEILLKWNVVVKRVGELIAVGRYLSEQEQKEFPEYEKRKIARGRSLQEESEQQLISDRAVTESENESADYDISEDTVVTIGMKDYEVEFLSAERVVLRDQQYPIFSEELSREEFDRKICENPANDHLKIKRPLPELPAEEEKEAQPTDVPSEETETELSIPEQNYQFVMKMAGEVLRGEVDSKTFEAGAGFMPLTIEQVGDNFIAISHYYEQNGDAMADPDMEFAYDNDRKTLQAKSGNILEPSCGVGNFIGMKPESLSDCKMYGVELDSVSGRIAAQLYQKSKIAVEGYEKVNLPDSFFDVAIGNVPFGEFKVFDSRYDRYNFFIHDYFFAKTLDKVRPGGVIAFITSSGTMDKKNPYVRRYLAQRAELIGAIRLPNDTFTKNAGTKVTSDILFLQKRDHMTLEEPDWVYLDYDDNGIEQNRYYVQHPEMILGEMVMESGPYGMRSTCRPYEGRELSELLSVAVEALKGTIEEVEMEELVEEEDHTIPADPSVSNYSYTLVDGKIYYRENSRMKPVTLPVTGVNRVKGMIAIRDCARELIRYQTEGYSDAVIEGQQKELNRLYDLFRSKYGLLNDRANMRVFADDNSYPLLSSLEILAEDGTLERKADMFSKRTIKAHKVVNSVDTASEALSISLAEKAKVDMPFMAKLTGKTEEELEQELSGVVFRLPESDTENPKYVSEDEYLSGNVREKLKVAELAAQADVRYQVNVTALQKVQPKDLSASEINIRLGTTWLPESDVEDFMFQLLNTPNYMQWKIKVHFSKYTGEWQVEGRSLDKGNVKANNTYGTTRVSAYRIIEDTLNLRDVRIYDYVEDDDRKKKAVLNKKETAIAQGKQDLIKQAFQDWIWKEPERRQRLTDYYNENFNAIRPREYDGSHLNFYGMNPEIRLREHQKNGVARILYGGNTLLAYVVGAGKTYTMVAAAMESKRLGLCHKSMVVVPNHIIEQFAAEWLQLYPAANLLVATKKDFETKNRKRFCARIATSDIDAVIIGHSQFERIPLSIERQQRTIRSQIEELVQGITEEKARNGNKFTIKQLEKTKKSLLVRLEKLNDQSKKDQVINFEELGIDRLFVDEADGYKNLYLYTKMRNVAGIAQTEALKSSDMFMKCQYLDELTGGKGVVFATGTPVSNSMVELYTMQRYLQHHTLVEHNLQHFDAWASTFGETVTAIELAPEGTGYRLKTRFAKFYNLPELMQMFREVADIQTADMLNLPVPKAEYRVVSVKPSEMQREMVAELGERAERVREGLVNATEDNMLLITNDGRKLALDQRMMNELLPDYPDSKVNACVEEVYQFWEQGREKRLTQLLFCDLSTPKTDGSFSVYNDVRDKLIAKGVPPEEIAFIHDANTEVRKKELFSKVRRGAVRILMGSTFKMGAGMNVQDLIIASHDLDCPWRPRDLEQRAGRTVRQGNQNPKVDIVRYVTEGTFDAYLYQIIENKQKFISQIMTSKSPARSVEDIDEVALSYAEIKALAVGNPYIKEKMDLDIQVSKLQLLKQSFLSQKYEMEDKAVRYFPNEIRQCEQRIADYESDIALAKENTPPDREAFPEMQIHDVVYTEKKEAGQAIIEACKAMKSADAVLIGRYRGFPMKLSYDSFQKVFVISMYGKQVYHVPLGTDIHGNITRLDNKIQEIPGKMLRCQDKLENLKVQLENAKEEAQKEFPQEAELAEKVARLGELNVLLDMDKKDQVLLDDGEGVEIEPEQKKREHER